MGHPTPDATPPISTTTCRPSSSRRRPSSRATARVCWSRRGAGRPLEHRVFRDLPELLDPDDLIVVNTTPRPATRGCARAGRPAAPSSCCCSSARGDGTWEALARPARRLAPGTALEVSAELAVELVERIEAGRWRVRPSLAGAALLAAPRARRRGAAAAVHPRAAADPARYQTVYADAPGSAAAPTAGLHLTPELLGRAARALRDGRASSCEIGLDTFRPVAEETVEAHPHPQRGATASSPAARAARGGARRGPRASSPSARRPARARDARRPRRPSAGRTSTLRSRRATASAAPARS